MPMRYFFILLTICSMTIAGTAKAEAPLRLVASIKPIHSLLSALSEGVAKPELLIKGQASPHGFSLRPSEARLIAEADLLFWVGPSLESFLKKPVASLGAKRAIALQNLSGMKLREGEHGDHGHEHEIDGHLWLDIANMRIFLREAAKLIGERRPAATERITANLKNLETKLNNLDEELRTVIAPLKGKPYIVFHDAYGYFEASYGLKSVGVVSVNPESKPSAKKLSDLKRLIGTSGAVCVFREPQFDAAFALTLIARTKAKIGTLDPLGADLPDGPELYFQLLRKLAAGFAECL
jgi:zinc transport system substrate-binding protein